MEKEANNQSEHKNEHRKISVTIDISMTKRRFSTPKLFVLRKYGKPEVSACHRPLCFQFCNPKVWINKVAVNLQHTILHGKPVLLKGRHEDMITS